MKLHPLQQYLPRGDVLQVAEQTLMTVVNQARRDTCANGVVGSNVRMELRR